MDDLTAALLNGSRRALARALTIIENGHDDAGALLAALYPHTGKAWIVGITGAPGTGKSTLVNALTVALRARGQRIAILAIDPTSPFTGGAILGDRIRMRDLAGDAGVFIRSMATRGNLGGLARAARDAIRAMDAAGFEIVLVETVGAGQNEVDIVRAAQTTVVVEAPGLGDDVQAIKAGILEIADVLVINKADRPGANSTLHALRTMLELGHPAARVVNHHGQSLTTQAATNDPAPLWMPPIIQTVASENRGIDALIEALEAHRAFLDEQGLVAQLERQNLENELFERLHVVLMQRLRHDLPASALADLIAQIQARAIDPQAAAERLLHHV